MTWFYGRVGLAALALLTGVLFTFQYLLRELLQSQHRAEALDARTRELQHPEEVGDVILPARHDPTRVVEPGEEPFDLPATPAAA